MSAAQPHDVIVVGAGHNGLVTALLLARAGLRTLVVEDKSVIGGAARTERPFAKARIDGDSLTAYAGAGIVDGSDPAEEWRETGHKLLAFEGLAR